MVMWFIVIALLLIGIGLIIVELVFIPGTTVVGILGLIFAIAGILVSYSYFGNDIGFYILLGSSITTLVALFYSFRTGAWNRFSLNSSIDSKVNEGAQQALKVGDEGITRSSLRPMGTAEFHNQNFEVKTIGQFLDVGTRVKIIQLQSNQIIVEPIH